MWPFRIIEIIRLLVFIGHWKLLKQLSNICNYTLSHDYVSQSFFGSIQKIIYLDNFPFNRSSLIAPATSAAIALSVCKISIIFHFCDSLKTTYTMKNGCVNTLKIDKGAQCTYWNIVVSLWRMILQCAFNNIQHYSIVVITYNAIHSGAFPGF